MKLGGSSREYMLHWIPISRAYDLENPFVAPLGEAEPFEEMEEKEHQVSCSSLPVCFQRFCTRSV